MSLFSHMQIVSFSHEVAHILPDRTQIIEEKKSLKFLNISK